MARFNEAAANGRGNPLTPWYLLDLSRALLQ